MDNVTTRAYHSILAQIEKLPSDAAVKIKAAGYSFHWDVMAVDIKSLLISFLFEVPALRNERNSALKNAEMLQEQTDDEIGTPENETDTVLKRALHYLELHAAHYHSSGTDEVVAELRQLIETEQEQIKGETLYFEPPKWEYIWLHNDDDDLDEVGADGWEAVLISGPLILFKRPK